jgi:hypothetical protein
MRGESTHPSARAIKDLPHIRITHFGLTQGKNFHGRSTAQADLVCHACNFFGWFQKRTGKEPLFRIARQNPDLKREISLIRKNQFATLILPWVNGISLVAW